MRQSLAPCVRKRASNWRFEPIEETKIKMDCAFGEMTASFAFGPFDTAL